MLVRGDKNCDFGDGAAASLADARVLAFSLCALHGDDARLALYVL